MGEQQIMGTGANPEHTLQPTTRTIEFRLAAPKDLAQRCEDANTALLRVQWAIEDLYQQCDADEAVIDVDTLSTWKAKLRDANAALALAAASLGSMDA